MSNVFEFSGALKIVEATPDDIKQSKIDKYMAGPVHSRTDLTAKEKFTSAFLMGNMESGNRGTFNTGMWAGHFAKGLTTAEFQECKAEAEVLIEFINSGGSDSMTSLELSEVTSFEQVETIQIGDELETDMTPTECLYEIFYLAHTAETVKRAFDLGQLAAFYSKDLSKEEIAQCSEDARDRAKAGEEDQKYFELDFVNAVIRGDLEAVEEAISLEEDVNKMYAPIHLAAIAGHADMVLALIEGGADVNHLCSDKSTPLHYAAANFSDDQVDIIEEMIELGAEVDAVNNFSIPYTPLMNAIFSAKVMIAKALIECGANVTNSIYAGKDTPLHRAAIYCHGKNAELLSILIDEGAEVNAKDSVGQTPLNDAARERNTVAVKLLMEAGAEVNALDIWGRTPLFGAISSRQPAIVKAFVAAGADVNLLPTDGMDVGQSALHRASEYGLTDIVQILIAAGANLEQKNKDGKTALQFAKEEEKQWKNRDNSEAIAALINAGAVEAA